MAELVYTPAPVTGPTAAVAGGRPTVLVAFHDGSIGGAALSIVRLAPLLERRGWALRFWAPEPLSGHLRALGLAVAGAPRPLTGFSMWALRHPPGARSRLRTTPAYLRAFVRHVRATSPALVHANSLYALPEALIARALAHPTLAHVHEMLPVSWKGTVAGTSMRAAGIEVVAVSDACARRLVEHGAGSVRIVPECAPVPPPRRRDKATPLVVGTVAAVCRRKGSDVFVEMVRRLRDQVDGDLEFRMIGSPEDNPDAPWGERVLAEARALGVLHQRQSDDVPGELENWDVFVLPSREDPFPIAVLEAMASGLPVVGTRVDGLAEQITPDTGLLVAPDDPEALATAVLALVERPDLRARTGAAGRARVERHFSLEHQAAGIDAAYRATLARRRAHTPVGARE